MCDTGTTGLPVTTSNDTSTSSGDNSTTTTNESDDSVSTGTNTTTDTATDTDSGADTDTDTDTGGVECVTVTPSGLLRDQGSSPSPDTARFFLEIDDFGVGSDTLDEFRLEFWFGAGDGTHDLGDATNSQYSSCRHCVRLIEDVGPETVEQDFFGGVQYFQSQGSLDVANDPQGGEISVTFEGVQLVEVSFSGITSTPVEDGGCIIVADGTYATPEVPKEWTCTPLAYTDVICDCGCGVADDFCADTMLETCDRCDDVGSCMEGGGACPGLITPDDTTSCDAPAGWTCPEETFADATCHCGCGVLDPDCMDATSASCTACNATGSCAAGGSDCSTIAAADNTSCI